MAIVIALLPWFESLAVAVVRLPASRVLSLVLTFPTLTPGDGVRVGLQSACCVPG